MFCKKCGNQVKDGAKFCPKCGCQITAEENNQMDRTVSQNRKAGKKWLAIFAVLAIVGATAVGSFLC